MGHGAWICMSRLLEREAPNAGLHACELWFRNDIDSVRNAMSLLKSCPIFLFKRCAIQVSIPTC